MSPPVTGATMPSLSNMILWGFVATMAMTTVLQGAQGLGFSRLSLPFLAGSLFTPDRRRAVVIGFVVYVIGGWAFAFLYFSLFASLHLYTWWFGMTVGLLHGMFLLVVVLPLLPYFHPRIASEYDGAAGTRLLEPPGFMGLNYGRRTPVMTLCGQAVYGAALGSLAQWAAG